MKRKASNIVPIKKNYTVQICNGMTVVASKVFTKKWDAITSAQRIIKNENTINPETTAYAMVWSGKQMIEYIDYTK